MRRRAHPFVALVLLLGCGDKDGDGSGSSSGSGDDTTGASSTGTPADTTTADSTGGDGGLRHGVVKLQLVRQDGADDPFAGTARIVATMRYGECLETFYAAHPELRQDGPEGEAVFGAAALGGEGWFDRLCAPMLDDQIACETIGIAQDLGIAQQLTVVYAVTGPIEDRVLLFGPLPTVVTAECAEGLAPTVRVNPEGAVAGTADNGTELWSTAAFSPAEVSTNAAGAVMITVMASGG